MKVTKQQLKEIVKQELKKVLAEQSQLPPSAGLMGGASDVEDIASAVAGRKVMPRPVYDETVPEWYKGRGGVAESLNEMRDDLLEEIKSLEERIIILERRPKTMKRKKQQKRPITTVTGGEPPP